MEDALYTRITLRIPKDLVWQISRAAFSTSKSQNAEIIGRLRNSFDPNASAQPLPPPSPLPEQVQQAVKDEIAKRDGTPDEVLTRLVLAGQTQGGTVLNIRVAPGTTAKEVRDAISAALELVPSDSSVIFEREAKG